MAEYGRVGSAADYAAAERRSGTWQPAGDRIGEYREKVAQSSFPETALIQVKTTQRIEVDFGPGPWTLEKFKEFVKVMEKTEGVGATAPVQVEVYQDPDSGLITWLKLIVTGG